MKISGNENMEMTNRLDQNSRGIAIMMAAVFIVNNAIQSL
jgi:hypothetical protein